MRGDFAISGTPGTGKSTVGRLLAPSHHVIEVAALARSLGAASGAGRAVEVDLARLRRASLRRRRPRQPQVVVGHLAHLLPIRDVVILRCRPDELAARLRRSHRGSTEEQYDNFVAEALDSILMESLGRRRRVWELDTTGRTPQDVARDVDRLIRLRPPASYGRIDWLADPTVTAHLLGRRR